MIAMRFLGVLAVLLFAASHAAAGDRYSEPRLCDAPSPAAPVCFAQRDWSEAEARAALGGRDLAAFAQGGVLNVVARRAQGPVSLCCAIVAPLSRIANSDLWVLSLRVWQLDRAVLDIQLTPLVPQPTLTAFYGSAVHRPAVVAELAGTISREVIESTALNQRRVLTLYLPPGFDRAERYPVVYMADGGVVPVYAAAIESLIVSGRLRPLIVVGLSPGSTDPGERSREYLPGRSAPRYAEHNRFVFDEVMPFVEGRYGVSPRREDRMLAGFSDGGAWALSAGLRHADRIGAVAALSFGWVEAAEGVDTPGRPRLFFGAGVLEPDFHATTARAARRAADSGGDVLFEDYTSGHTLIAFQSLLLDALVWNFPRRPQPG